MHATTAASKLSRAYRGAALFALNATLFFVALNLAAALWLQRLERRDAGDPRLLAQRRAFADLDAYARLPRDVVERCLDEQLAAGALGLGYAPWVQFRNPEFHGRLLETDARGFRRSAAPAARAGAPFDVDVFGGSTTFGYGVPDDETIPSHLQRALEELHPGRAFRVRNLGQSLYYSSQELALLVERLKPGDPPAHAVFVDGMNDTAQLALEHDQPHFTGILREAWQAARDPARPWGRRQIAWLPALRLLRRWELLGPFATPSAPLLRQVHEGFDPATSERRAAYVVARYSANQRSIRALCAAHGVGVTFVWQPVPFYKYERRLHKTFPYPRDVPAFWAAAYERMGRVAAPDFLYLGDMFEGTARKVFVDDVHYNEAVNQEIARRIASFMRVE